MFSYIICVRVCRFYGDSFKGRALQARSIFCSLESFVGDVYRSVFGKLNTKIALVINTRRNPYYRTNVPTPFLIGCGRTLPSSIPQPSNSHTRITRWLTKRAELSPGKLANEASRGVP